jgi:Fur family peroxide stress response transcriptional regulator
MQLQKEGQSLELFHTKCRENGLKVTPQRVAIYKRLIRSKSHPTAEQLYKIVKKRFNNISLDTINRTLITFARIGLISVVEGFGSPRRYDSNLHKHHHVHCIKCGAIFDFEHNEYDSLNVPRSIQRKFDIINKRVVLNGICAICQRG